MKFYQDIFFRSMDYLRGRKTIDRLKFLRRSQFWDKETLEQWQLSRLNDLLIQAKENSPYYREKLSEVTLPLVSLSDLDNIPILNKDDVRSNGEKIKCRNISPKRFVASRTGGSTGEPMHYFWDKKGMDWNRGSVYRSGEWANVHLGERTIQMSGSHFDFGEMQKLKSKFIFFLQRYKDLSIAFMNADLLEGYFNILEKYRPTSIWGYASGVHGFAKHIKEYHPNTDFSYLKAIVTSSENLGSKHRELINSVFGADKVFDNYGSREMYIAAECKQHNGYHIHGEVIIVEVVNKENKKCQPGELGRIVLTDLSNHAFPFIRYEIGDIGSMAREVTCACGIRLPMLQTVEGRIADTIVIADRILTAPNFTLIFSDMKGVKSYQIRQDSKDKLKVQIVPDENYSMAVDTYIRESLHTLTGGVVQLQIEQVDKIDVPESGKRRFIISTISKEEL